MTSPDPIDPAPRRLRRSATDRKVAGVSGGIAEHFDLDPSMVRIGFAALTLLGGLGLALYAICALILPNEDGAPEMARKHKIALIAITVAAVCSFPFFGTGAFLLGPGIGGVLVVGALGVVVWRAVGGQPDSRLLKGSVIVVTMGAAIVFGAAAAFATALGGGVVAASVVVVLGVALIVGGFFGGARWLILPALMMALPVAVVSAADIEFKGGVGDRQYRPASVEDLRPIYRLGAGRLRVDLRDVEFSRMSETDLDLRVGTGRIRLITPPDVCVQTTAHAGAGHINLDGRESEGVDVDADRRPEASITAPILRVDARAGLGEIIVSSSRSGCEDR